MRENKTSIHESIMFIKILAPSCTAFIHRAFSQTASRAMKSNYYIIHLLAHLVNLALKNPFALLRWEDPNPRFSKRKKTVKASNAELEEEKN